MDSNMTVAKRWPDNCEAARMNSISKARQARNCIKLALQNTNNPEIYRNNIIEALESMHEIETLLITCRNDPDNDVNGVVFRANGQVQYGEDDR